MASGHPDWQSWSGRAAGGEVVKAKNFTGSIASGITGTVTFDTVAAGKQHIYQFLFIASDDDTAIHFGDFYRNSDSVVFFSSSFVTGVHSEFPGMVVEAGDVAKLEITNNAASSVTFFGSVFWVERSL